MFLNAFFDVRVHIFVSFGNRVILEVVIINAGYRVRRNLHRVPKPVVTFYWVIKAFVSYLLAYQTFSTNLYKYLVRKLPAILELTKKEPNKTKTKHKKLGNTYITKKL